MNKRVTVVTAVYTAYNVYVQPYFILFAVTPKIGDEDSKIWTAVIVTAGVVTIFFLVLIGK